jgi:hypothetical protein
MDETDAVPAATHAAQPQAWSEGVSGIFAAAATTPQQSRVGRIVKEILPAVGCTLLGAAVAFGGSEWLHHDRSEPAAQLHSEPVAQPRKEMSPEDRYFGELGQHEIQVSSDPLRYRIIEMAMQACYNLTPPNPQTFAQSTGVVLTALATDSRTHPDDAWVIHNPSIETAQVIVRAAVHAYCPAQTGSLE